MVGPTVGDVETLSALGGQLGKLMLSLRRFRSRLTGIVLGGCLAVGACGGGSGGGTPTTPTSPSGGGANAETPGFLDILDRTFQVRTRASYAPSVPPHDGYSWEFRDQTRPGRLTVNVNWEPAATRVRLRLVRNENFPGNRGCVNLPEAGCTTIHEGASGSSPQEFVIDPLPVLPVPPPILPDQAFFPIHYFLLIFTDGSVEINGALKATLIPDLTAPGVPVVEGDWGLGITLTGPTNCGGRAVPGLLEIGFSQNLFDLIGSILNTDNSILEGLLEIDGTFVLAGEVTPLLGANNEIRGVTRQVTLTGQVSGNFMSGSISQRFADGCTSTGTFSGNKR